MKRALCAILALVGTARPCVVAAQTTDDTPRPNFIFINIDDLGYSNDMGPAEDGVKSSLGAPIPKQKGKGQPPLPLLRNETVLQRALAERMQDDLGLDGIAPGCRPLGRVTGA